MQLYGKTLLFKNEINSRKLILEDKKNKNNFSKIKNVLENIPKGATHVYGGNFFKKGSHGFTFVFHDNEWRRTEEIKLKEFMRL